MKKLFLALCMFLATLVATAQTRGDKAIITSPGKMYTSYIFTYDDSLTIVNAVGYETFLKIKANFREDQNWPSGLLGLDNFFDNEENIKKYTAFFECKFTNTYGVKYILRIPVKENAGMITALKPTSTLYFIIGEAGATIEPKSSVSSTTGGTRAGTTSGPVTAVTVTDYGQLYSTYEFSTPDREAVKAAVGETELPNVFAYATEDLWPEGIATLEQRNVNRPKMYNYKVDYVCSFSNKVLLKASKAKNKNITGNMALTADIYFVVGDDAVKFPTGTVFKAVVTDYAEIYSTPNITSDFEDAISKAVGPAELSNVLSWSNEAGWPAGLATLEMRDENRSKMYNYVTEYVCTHDSYTLIKAPKAKNAQMTGNMALTHDIYFVVGKDYVTKGAMQTKAQGGSTTSTGGTTSTTADPAFEPYKKAYVTDYGKLNATYVLTPADISEIQDVVGNTTIAEVKKYVKQASWPAGISTASALTTNRAKMYDYSVDYICTFSSGSKVLVKVSPAKNTDVNTALKLTHPIYLVIGIAGVTVPN